VPRLRGPAGARGAQALSTSRLCAAAALFAALLSSACREPPARDARRIAGAPAEIRAIGLRRPVEAALNAAFATLEPGDAAGVDRAVALLRAAGARKGLVNMGGRRLAVFGEPLTVAVRDPRLADGPRWATVTLQEAALATVDPGVAGAPRDDRVLSVSVVAKDAVAAQALAAAAAGLSPELALARLTQEGAGFVLTREGGTRVIAATPGFAAAWSLAPEAGVVLRP
jgi:ApbE family